MLKHRFTRLLVPSPENILDYEKAIATVEEKELIVR